jgi:chromosome segregation ATPase
MRSLDTVLGSSDGVIKARREHANRILGVTCHRVRASFVEGMQRRRYGGRLKIDHECQVLELKVRQPGETEYIKVQSLSGGEKSYALTSLLLALWDVMDCPFFGVDEFDVFLDAVNRSAAVKFMIQEAMQNSKHQYIFITPLSLAMVDVSDPRLRMFQMDA